MPRKVTRIMACTGLEWGDSQGSLLAGAINPSACRSAPQIQPEEEVAARRVDPRAVHPEQAVEDILQAHRHLESLAQGGPDPH